jgi:hypothetical protein
MNKKKILSIGLILVFILSIINLNQISYAKITQTQDKGNINVSNIEEGVNVYLYKIATMEYDYVSNQPKEGYNWESTIKNWIDTNYPSYSNTENFYKEVESNSEEAKRFYDELTSAIKDGEIDVSVYKEAKSKGTPKYPVTTENLKGNAKFSEVDMGTYLVIIENGYMVYTPSVVNVIPTFNAETKDWILEDKNVVIKATNPSITKTITDEEKKVDNFSTIDEITYTIKADIPKYLENSLSKKYYISDILDKSLTINEETLTIYGLKTGNEPESISGYTISFNTERPDSLDFVTFLIDFDYSKISSYETIKIVYKAKLSQNSDLVLGTEGNNNYAYLSYSNNPYSRTSIQTQSTEKITVYTYGLEIKSVDKDDTNTPLPGSEYSISDEEGNDLYFIKEADGEYYLAKQEDEGATTKLAVDENGNLNIKGLDEGNYVIRQTKAPDGYNISSKSYEIELIDSDLDGELDDDYNLLFYNTKGFILPTTGGRGIVALVCSGIILIGIGILLLVSINKKKKILKNKNM